jgi:uncharacterized HAD superfamily protein
MARDRCLILTDVDETVLQFAQPFQDWCIANGHQTRGTLRDDYSIEAMLDCTRERAEEILDAFAKAGGMIEQPTEICAATVLPRLYAAGHDFVAITACGLDEDFRQERWLRLGAAFGFPWQAVHVVELGGCKESYLRFYDQTVWVEDNVRHAAAGARLGHQVFLLDRAYNRGFEHDGVTRVRDWHEIADRLG